MSRFIQIDIRLLPMYGSGGMQKSFPHLSKALKDFGYTKVLEEEPTLYRLAEVLLRIGNDPAVSQKAKAPIIGMADRFRQVHAQAQEHLLGRRLNELDQTLYRLEDLFQELEQELGWA